MSYDRVYLQTPHFHSSHQNPKASFHLRLLHKAFERVKFEDGVIGCKIINDLIVPIYKESFLHAIGFAANPQGFQVVESSPKEFQSFFFLNQIQRGIKG